MDEEVRGSRSTNKKSQNSHGNVKSRNGVGRKLIHMTHGNEQWGGHCLKKWEVLGGGGKRGKNQDNCNSTINKYNF